MPPITSVLTIMHAGKIVDQGIKISYQNIQHVAIAMLSLYRS